MNGEMNQSEDERPGAKEQNSIEPFWPTIAAPSITCTASPRRRDIWTGPLSLIPFALTLARKGSIFHF